MLTGKRKLKNILEEVANENEFLSFYENIDSCGVIGSVDNFYYKINVDFNNKNVVVETYKQDLSNGDATKINVQRSRFAIHNVTHYWVTQMAMVTRNTLKSAVSTQVLDKSQIEEFVEVVRDQVYDRMHGVMSECLDRGVDDVMDKIDINAVLEKFTTSK